MGSDIKTTDNKFHSHYTYDKKSIHIHGVAYMQRLMEPRQR